MPLLYRPAARTLTVVALFGLLSFGGATAEAGGIFGNTGLNGGFRWDADPRVIGGFERSLDGGLRYSMQGRTFEGYRDLFTWVSTPTVADFQQAIEDAFAAWMSVDPVTGLTTALSFVNDPGTAAVGTSTGGGINTAGAEIDLLAAIDANTWNPGDSGTRGESFFNAVGGPLTLTSGTAGYNAGAISGADITINNNPGAQYTLEFFRRLLTHEIGHALGFADVDVQSGPSGNFIDDNYDATSSATALATLTNSWALLVNPLNPSASVGLSLYTVANGNPGIDTPGVDILMESQGLGIAIGNPVTNLVPLTNDDYGIRQFLYPSLTSVPEPLTLVLLGIGVAGRHLSRRRQQRG